MSALYCALFDIYKHSMIIQITQTRCHQSVLPKPPVVFLSKKRNPYCLVLVVSKIGFESDLHKPKVLYLSTNLLKLFSPTYISILFCSTPKSCFSNKTLFFYSKNKIKHRHVICCCYMYLYCSDCDVKVTFAIN